MKNVKFGGYDCFVRLEKYSNGNTRIQLYDAGDCEPVATATVNLGKRLPGCEAYIKDYAENEGILQVLRDADIVKETLGYTRSGLVLVPLCRISWKDLDR